MFGFREVAGLQGRRRYAIKVGASGKCSFKPTNVCTNQNIQPPVAKMKKVMDEICVQMESTLAGNPMF